MRFWIVLAVVLVVAAFAVGVSRNEKTPPAFELPRPQVVDMPATSTPPARQAKKLLPPTAPPASAAATSTPSPVATSTPPAPAAPSLFVAFTLEADDAAFYPNSVSVDRDQTVSLTFRVRSAGVYGGGLDIRSSYFDTGSVAAGAAKTISFRTPEKPETITFTSFAQGTGNKKAEGAVVVE